MKPLSCPRPRKQKFVAHANDRLLCLRICCLGHTSWQLNHPNCIETCQDIVYSSHAPKPTAKPQTIASYDGLNVGSLNLNAHAGNPPSQYFYQGRVFDRRCACKVSPVMSQSTQMLQFSCSSCLPFSSDVFNMNLISIYPQSGDKLRQTCAGRLLDV